MNQRPDIGTLLRDTRSRFGWSLEDVAHRTRIPVAHLRNLEANSFATFPSRSYAKSFLTQYSEHLGIDPIEWLDDFDAAAAPDESDHPAPPADKSDSLDEEPLVLKRGLPKKPAPRVDRPREETANHRPRSSAGQPLLVFTVTAGLISAAVLGFMKLSENLSGPAADTAANEEREERLGPVSGITSSRPEIPDFSSVPRAQPVTSEGHLVAGDPSTSGTETLRATPTTQQDPPTDLANFTLDNPPPRAVIVEE